MASKTVSVAAATAVVGYDLLQDEYWQQQPYMRFLDGLALCGSAAAGDTEVEIFIGQIKTSVMFNSKTGFPDRDDIIPSEPIRVPGGAQLHAYVTDAPATNPINLMMLIRP